MDVLLIIAIVFLLFVLMLSESYGLVFKCLFFTSLLTIISCIIFLILAPTHEYTEYKVEKEVSGLKFTNPVKVEIRTKRTMWCFLESTEKTIIINL